MITIRYRYATLSSVQMLDRTTCAGAHWLGGRWRTRSRWWGSSWRCRSPRCRGPASRRRGRGCCPHSVSAAGWASSLHLPAKCVGFEPGLQMFHKFTTSTYWGNVTADRSSVMNPTIPLVCTMATKSAISPPPAKTDSETSSKGGCMQGEVRAVSRPGGDWGGGWADCGVL